MSNRIPRIVAISLVLAALAATAGATEIHWRTGSVTTTFANSADVALELATARSSGHRVVQFDQPVTPAQQDQLRAAGLTLLNYLGDNAYFATVDVARLDATALAQVPSLRTTLPIDPAWKLHPDLLAGDILPWTIVTPNAAGPDEQGNVPAVAATDNPLVATIVLFHADVDLEGDGLATVLAYGADVRSLLPSLNGVVVHMPYANLYPLAAEDGVQTIEPPLPRFDVLNNSNREITGANLAQANPYGLDGAGINVMVYDGGSVLTTHPDLAGRVTVRDGSALGDHPTHVAGTIGGDGTASAGFYRGMAPAVKIESYSFETAGPLQAGFLYTDPGDINQDYGDAINNHGVDLANNSIGSNVARNGFPCEWTGDYGATSAVIDALVRGSLGKPFRTIWANGNERSTTNCGDLYHTTAPPACAKNHITVGALNSNDDSVTSFTSWGPADDGRLKPDISAPGCQSNDDQGVTSCSSAGGYNTKCGTSMATPTVTGLAALLLQDYRVQFPGKADFTSATLKGLLAHSARDVVTPGPDYQSGYGSVRIVDAIELMRSGNFYESEIAAGQTHPSVVLVGENAPALRVTLVWDDYPATPNVIPSLVNDLDLRVIDMDGVVHYPWTLDPNNPALPAVRTQPDHLNNIEQVVIDFPPPGAYIVEVVAHNMPHGPQTFSLVATPMLIDCTPAGALTLDRAAYTCEGTVTVRLNDCHLNTNDTAVETVQVPVTSTTEPAGELVTLTETGPQTADFVGQLPLSATDAPGVLWVAEGDTLTATYIDADDGNGGTNVVVQKSAPVDCSAPLVTNVAAVDLGPRSARITFNTNEPAQALVRYGLSCDGLTEVTDAPGANTTHSIALTGLTDNTQYFFQIEAVDAAGNLAVANDGGICFTFTTTDIPDYFTQQFFGNFDLANHAIMFEPNGTIDYYSACLYETLVLPTDPAGGNALVLNDDGSATIPLVGGPQVQLYGTAYSTIYVNANGNVTFDQTDSDASESYDDHFDNPRVSALFDDLDPSLRGQVLYQQLPDRFVVTWLGVAENGIYNSNTFQIELYYDGRIQLAWLEVASLDGLVGLSQGLETPIDFLPSALSKLPSCGLRPPSAGHDTVIVGQDREATITLHALDDGDPNPPGALTYAITGLPAYELRDAGNGHIIQAAELPYTLLGNQVIYLSTGYVGQDTFTFVANDGGVPPTGGDSNTAVITVQVNPVLTLPFSDSFPTTTYDPLKWADVFNATIDDVGLSIPSPPYAARLNGMPIGLDSITTHLIDLSTAPGVRLAYSWQRTGDGESPDSGDNLRVEFRDANGQWELIAEYAGDGPDMTAFATETVLLPASALHSSFQLRFEATGSSGSSPYDDWFVDDVSLSFADAPFAHNLSLTVEVNSTRDIALDAVDPNLDPLTFVILTLPEHGTLSDPNGGVITAGDLPYAVMGNGNVVRYAPNAGYQGPDVFEYLANDGTYDSNVATVRIAVEPILSLPFADDFPTNSFDSGKWAVVQGATIDNVGLAEPSLPYAARFNAAPAGGDVLQTFAINLEGISPVRLHYYWERTGGGDSPESGEDFFVEYLDPQGVWQILNRHDGNGSDMTQFELADIPLPAAALHADFRLRFRSTSGGVTGDDWFVDDVLLFLPVVPQAFPQSLQIAKYSYAAVTLLGIDPNDDPLEYIIVALPAVGELVDVGTGQAIDPNDLPYTLAAGGNAVNYFPPLGFTGDASFDFQVTDGVHDSNVATIAVEVTATESGYTYLLNEDPGWSTEGQWAFGQPLGHYGDPSFGHTGNRVYGYNLDGRYANNIPVYYLTTTAIDCSQLTSTRLEFYRWLGVEENYFDHATLEASNNGVNWTLIWQNGTSPINEKAWTFQSYDLSAVADRQSTVFVRWGMGPSDGGVNYHGWNIDDVVIAGVLQPVDGDLDGDGDVNFVDRRGFEACFMGLNTPPNPPAPMTPGDCLDAFDFDNDGDVDCSDWDEFVRIWTGPPSHPGSMDGCVVRGDMNCDGAVDVRDIDPFVQRLIWPNEYWAQYPDCPDTHGDLNADGVVNFADINPFVDVLLKS